MSKRDRTLLEKGRGCWGPCGWFLSFSHPFPHSVAALVFIACPVLPCLQQEFHRLCHPLTRSQTSIPAESPGLASPLPLAPCLTAV